MSSVRLVCVSSCLLLSLQASAQTLWQGTSYGMSVQEVRAVVPGVVSPQKPGLLGSGAKELLRLESIKLVNHNFEARFYFKDAKLTQVTLSLDAGDESVAGMLFDSLSEALRAKYGRELSREARGDIVQATWFSDRTNINLLMLLIGDDVSVLNLNYQVELAREADKL